FGILNGEALDGDVAARLDVDAVGGLAIACVDGDAGVSLEGDGLAGRTALLEIPTEDKAGIGSGQDTDGVTGQDVVGGVLQGQPGRRRRAAIAVVPIGRDNVSAQCNAGLEFFNPKPPSLFAAHSMTPCRKCEDVVNTVKRPILNLAACNFCMIWEAKTA